MVIYFCVVDDSFLHKIDLKKLQEEVGIDSVEGIGKFLQMKNPKGVYNWSKDKESYGSRPSYNDSIRLLQKGATQKTLFGVEPKQPDPETTGSENIDYSDPKFQEAFERAMKVYQRRKEQGIIK